MERRTRMDKKWIREREEWQKKIAERKRCSIGHRGWVRSFARGVGLPRGFGRIWKFVGSGRVAGKVGAWLILHTTRIGQVWEIGLAFWLVCPLCPSSANHPLEMALPLLTKPPSFPISRERLYGYIDVARVYTRRCNVYAWRVFWSIYPRETKKASLSRISGGKRRRGLASNERFVRSSRTYLWAFQARFFHFHIAFSDASMTQVTACKMGTWRLNARPFLLEKWIFADDFSNRDKLCRNYLLYIILMLSWIVYLIFRNNLIFCKVHHFLDRSET